ncbi:retrovirus-related pol polyprotein [Lentinula edodes]|uniref:Retrovirus-related pol polyprotein n=1 Tax=Lentinula edodes TaxID=5353 RepID=A0A1Q3DX40_LENED|nr:retrovirus-related pol polyprotein [Lentinula edodes]
MAASIIYLNIVDPVGLGIEHEKPAYHIWTELKKKYERQDEMHVHQADTKLRSARFDPSITTIEEHKKTMKNHLKELRNLGGSCLDSQCCLIVIASMPKSWRDLLINVKGISSDDVFIHLHQVYDNKKEDEEDARQCSQVRALIAQEMASFHSANTVSAPKKDHPTCTNPNCPPRRHRTHTIEKCWAPGGGNEGGGPKKAETAVTQTANYASDGGNHTIMELFDLCTYTHFVYPTP